MQKGRGGEKEGTGGKTEKDKGGGFGGRRIFFGICDTVGKVRKGGLEKGRQRGVGKFEFPNF